MRWTGKDRGPCAMINARGQRSVVGSFPPTHVCLGNIHGHLLLLNSQDGKNLAQVQGRPKTLSEVPLWYKCNRARSLICKAIRATSGL